MSTGTIHIERRTGVYADSGLSTRYLKSLAAGHPVRPSEDDRGELEDVRANIARDCLGK